MLEAAQGRPARGGPPMMEVSYGEWLTVGRGKRR
jgi:hypothetical protein